MPHNDLRKRVRKGRVCSESTCIIQNRHKFYGCRSCGMDCAGEHNYTAHINGKKHLSNLVRGHIFFPCRFCKQNIQATSWEGHMSKHPMESFGFSRMIPGEEVTVDFSGHKFCAICQTHIAEDLWGTHLTSSRHMRWRGFVEFKDRLCRKMGETGSRVLLEDPLDFGVLHPLTARVGAPLRMTIHGVSQSKISLIDIKLASERTGVPSPFSISIKGPRTFITPTKSPTLNLEFKSTQVGKYTDTITFIFEDLYLKKRFPISRQVQAIIGSSELHMSDMDMVPPEVWSKILFFATRPPSQCYPLTTTTYKPFDLSPVENLTGHLSTLQLRARIVLVCHQWNALGSPYLYEFLRLSHSSSFQGLLETLERSGEQRQVAQYVRCAVLPYERNPLISPLHILKLLPNLEVLVRSHSPPYDWPMPPPTRFTQSFPLTSMSQLLGNLKRIDCAEHRFAGATTGGLNHLPSTLRACTSLEYLSISGDLCETRDKVDLPSLIILRAERFISTDRICNHWSMDNLRHVVLHLNLNHTRLLKFWRRFGAKLHTVELATSPGDIPRLNDEISDVLQYCPNLIELSYHIEFSQAPSFRNGVHTSLLALRIHAGYSTSSLPRHRPLFDRITAHFNAFSKNTAPCLEEVTLCGVWTDDKPVIGINNILQAFGTSYVGPRVEREVTI